MLLRPDVSVVERETKATQGIQSTEEDHCVVRLDGMITIVRRRLKQEVSITVATYGVRVSYYICYLSLAERCYRCGKIGHINKNCKIATRKRAQRQTMTGTKIYLLSKRRRFQLFIVNFLDVVNFLSSFFQKKNKTNNNKFLYYLRFLFLTDLNFICYTSRLCQ